MTNATSKPTRSVWTILGCCGLVLLLASCGASAVGSEPNRLVITMSGPTNGTHTWTVTDASVISKLYDHVRALRQIPSTASIACRPIQEQYQFTFSQDGTVLLQGSVSACSGYMHMKDNTYRALDGDFWQQVDQAAGQHIAPGDTVSGQDVVA